MPKHSPQTWLIGDIHGCLKELNALLEKLPRDDKLIFLGDYIDRGPDSKGCIERLMQEKHRSIYLRGNHEQMLLDYFQEEEREISLWLHRANGGRNTLRSYKLKPEAEYTDLPATHREFIEGLPLYHESNEYIAVHAGVNTAVQRLDQQSPRDLLYIRMNWISKEASWPGKHVIFGHTPARYLYGRKRQNEIIQGLKSTGIDTGCVYGGSLTALNPATREIIQVAASHAHH